MSFHDQVAADIDNVFLNTEEFGEQHNLNGVECLAVISGDISKKRSTLASRNFDGLHGDFIAVTTKKASLKSLPAQGQNFKLDGKLYKVDDCTDDMGMLTILLGTYRMGGAG